MELIFIDTSKKLNTNLITESVWYIARLCERVCEFRLGYVFYYLDWGVEELYSDEKILVNIPELIRIDFEITQKSHPLYRYQFIPHLEWCVYIESYI